MTPDDRPRHRPTIVLIRESLLYIPAVVAPALAGIATILILTRLLTPQTFGEYALAMATATGVSSISSDWLTTTSIRFDVEANDEPRLMRQLNTLTAVALLATIPVVSLVLLNFVDRTYVLAGASLAAATVLSKVVVGLARSRRRVKLFSVITVLGSLGTVALGIGFYLATDSAPSIIWAAALVSIATTLAFTWGARVKGFLSKFARLQDSKSPLRFGLPIIVTGLGGQILLLADRFILDAMVSSAAVGIYVPNYALAERSIGFVFAPLFNALYPLAARAWANDDRGESGELLQVAQRAFVIVGGMFTAILIVFGEEISALAVGSRFSGGSEVIGLAAVGTLFWFSGILFHQPVELEKRTLVIMVQVVAAGSLNIVLNVILIPILGIQGAAWATLSSYGAYMVSANILSKRLTGTQMRIPWDAWIRVVVFTGLVWLAADLLEIPLWIGLGGVPLAYVLYLWATREPSIGRVLELVRRKKFESPAESDSR
jgi:O-antigen/teichoic acid export membrane protein